jgi:hypothetical protein
VIAFRRSSFPGENLPRRLLVDFIERLFHLSPDGGNGSAETLVASLTLALVIAVLLTASLRAELAH